MLLKSTRVTYLFAMVSVSWCTGMELPYSHSNAALFDLNPAAKSSAMPSAPSDPQPLHGQLGERLGGALMHEVFQYIQERGDLNNAYGRNLLWRAVTDNQRVLVRILLIHGVDVNGYIHNDMTALHGASLLSDSTLLKELVAHGADVNAPGPLGQTPLWLAIGAGELESMHFLLSCGAELETRLSQVCGCAHCKDNEETGCPAGVTALHSAITEKKEKIVIALLMWGAEYDACDVDFIKSMLTDLERAVVFGTLTDVCAKFNDAQAYIRNNALTLAIGRGCLDKIVFLLNCGTSPAIGLLHVDRILHRMNRVRAFGARVDRYRFIRDLLNSRLSDMIIGLKQRQ